MNRFVLFNLVLCLALHASWAFAQEEPARLREVRGQTIVSKELPVAEFTFGKGFRYVGGQRVNLYGNAEAEQHVFVKAGNSGAVERFYWVQFEHFFPTNTHTYEYVVDRTTQIGDLQFIYDVKSWPDYAALQTEDRTELMIIYGEALPEGSKIPVRKDGVELDKDDPDSARMILDDARRDLSVRKP